MKTKKIRIVHGHAGKIREKRQNREDTYGLKKLLYLYTGHWQAPPKPWRISNKLGSLAGQADGYPLYIQHPRQVFTKNK